LLKEILFYILFLINQYLWKLY